MSTKLIILLVLGCLLLVPLSFIGQVFLTLWIWNALASYFHFQYINLFIAFVITLALWIIGGLLGTVSSNKS